MSSEAIKENVVRGFGAYRQVATVLETTRKARSRNWKHSEAFQVFQKQIAFCASGC